MNNISNIQPNNSNNQNLIPSQPPESLQNVLTEVALAALTLPTNLNQNHLWEGYYTTYFINSIQSLSGQPQPSLQPIDTVLYHAILYTFLNTVGRFNSLNNDYVMTVLSTPAFVRYAVQQPWFKQIKKDCQAMLVHFSGKSLLEVGKYKVKNYLKQELEWLQDLVVADKTRLFNHLQSDAKDFIGERAKLTAELSIEGFNATVALCKTAASVNQLSDLATQDNLEHSLNFIENTEEKLSSLLAKPKLSIIKSKKEDDSSLLGRCARAWMLTSYLNPALGPLFSTAATPNVSELAIRVAGAYQAYSTENYLQWIVLTEVAVKVNPIKLGQVTVVNRFVDHLKEDFTESLRDEGVSSQTIKKIHHITAMSIGAGIYTVINLNSHPFYNAISCSSFIEYLGIMGDRMDLVDQKHLTGERSLLRIPFQLISGVAFSVLDLAAGQQLRPVTNLAVVAIANPLMMDQFAAATDQLIASDYFQNKFVKSVTANIPDDVKSAIRMAGNIPRVVSFTMSHIPSFSSVPGGGMISQTLKFAFIVAPITLATKHPAGKKAVIKATEMASKVVDVYLKSSVAESVGLYLGVVTGAATNAIGKPMDLPTLGAVTAGMTVTIITQSTLWGTATTELANQALRTSFAQPYVAKVRGLFNQATSYVKSTYQSFEQAVTDHLTISPSGMGML